MILNTSKRGVTTLELQLRSWNLEAKLGLGCRSKVVVDEVVDEVVDDVGGVVTSVGDIELSLSSFINDQWAPENTPPTSSFQAVMVLTRASFPPHRQVVGGI